jgi:hypothetical protein
MPGGEEEMMMMFPGHPLGRRLEQHGEERGREEERRCVTRLIDRRIKALRMAQRYDSDRISEAIPLPCSGGVSRAKREENMEKRELVIDALASLRFDIERGNQR